MIDGDAMSVDEEPARKQPQHGRDFSNLHGLQVVGDQTAACGDHSPDDSLWREALKLELEARAARFHQAIDASIVLANDGVIRWLGDPIAKLAPGSDLLTPRAVILADACLPDGAREAVAARLELWLAATTRRLLGPLFALRDLQEGSEAVRGLAAKIAESLGVLEREPIRNQIKALDQNSRAALRKHGVRFGAYYVYVPTVLKPAARALALQLRSLETPEVDDEGLVNSLVPHGVVRANVSAGRSGDFDGQLSRRGLSFVRRPRRAGRHRRAACRHDSRSIRSARPFRRHAIRKPRVCGQRPDDVASGMFRRNFRLDPSVAGI